ncbi:MAG: hypothetical protein ACE5K2_07435, partial [Candidatus Zixiibacteriota bacterium]
RKSTRVLFYDDEFNLISEHPGGGAYISKNSNYVGIRRPEGEGPTGYPTKLIFELYDRQGIFRWSKELPSIHEYHERFYVADNGLVVGVHPKGTVITFYNEDGEEVKKADIFGDMKWLRGRGYWGDFSADGKYFAFTTSGLLRSDKQLPQINVKSVAIMFTTDGEELWRFHPDEAQSQGIVLSPSGNYAVASYVDFYYRRLKSGDRGVYLLDGDGRLIRKYKDIHADQVQFSSSGAYVMLVIDGRERVLLVETDTGDIVFDFKPSGKDIFAMDIAEKGELIGLVIDYGNGRYPPDYPSWSKPQVLILNYEGGLLWSRQFAYIGESLIRNQSIRLSDSGNQVTVGIGDKVYKFSLDQTEK